MHLPLCLAQSSHGAPAVALAQASPRRVVYLCSGLMTGCGSRLLWCETASALPASNSRGYSKHPGVRLRTEEERGGGGWRSCTATASHGVSSRRCELGTRDGTFRKSEAEQVVGKGIPGEKQGRWPARAPPLSPYFPVSGSVLSLWYLKSQRLTMGGLGEFSGAGALDEWEHQGTPLGIFLQEAP